METREHNQSLEQGNLHSITQTLSAEIFQMIKDLDEDKNGFVEFGNVARGVLGQQSQYASRYLDPVWQNEGYLYCGEGLRVE